MIVATATGEAAAAPVDNADDGIFIFYDNPSSPFLDFSSSTSVSSEAMGTNPASFFKADIASNGATTFQNSLDMRRHLTALAIGDDITVQLTILDIHLYKLEGRNAVTGLLFQGS